MTPAERNKKFRAELSRRQRVQPRIQRDTFAEIERLLGVALTNIRATLASQPSDFQQFVLPQLQRQIEATLNDFSERGAAAIADGAGQAWLAGQALVDAPIAAGGVQIAAVLPALDTRPLAAMRTFMTERIKNIGVQSVNSINQELGLVAIGAQAPNEAVSNITRFLRARSRARALTIVRTEVGRVFSVATQSRLEQARQLLPGLKKKWIKTGKRFPRVHHDVIDGQVREVNELFRLGNGVELRFPRDPRAPAGETINCSHVMVPHMETWETRTPARAL